MRNPQIYPLYGRKFPSIEVAGPLVVSSGGDITIKNPAGTTRITIGGGTNDNGIVFGNLGTATRMIDGSSAGLSGSGDYWLYFNANNYWNANGGLVVSSEMTVHDINLSKSGSTGIIRNSAGVVSIQSTLSLYRSGHGSTYIHTHQEDTLADDGTITLETYVSGFIIVSCNAECGLWLVQNDGTCTKVAGTANTADTDSDGNLCVYDGGNGGIVKNRLGAAGEIRYFHINA